MGNKEEMLDSIIVMKYLLKEIDNELRKARTIDGRIFYSDNGEYSLEKVKPNCTTIRELLLELRKDCEWSK